MSAVDNKYFNDVGTKTYSIIIVYNNGELSPPFTSNSIFKSSNLKNKTLKSMILRGKGQLMGDSDEQKTNQNFSSKMKNFEPLEKTISLISRAKSR